MALFNKGRGLRGQEHGRVPEEVGAGGRAEERAVEGQGGDQGQRLNAYLGKGSSVTGKLSFSGAVKIDGRIEGEITGQETLVIGESAVVNAHISGNTVVVTGRVTGDITARKRVEIKAPGRLFGNVSTPVLVVEEGVVFEGHCAMGAADPDRERKVARLPRDEKGREKGANAQTEAVR